ncbi:MAG: outer membrane protein assembly factor BamE [Gallionella sp.]|nr:outer membrane protein assembly factor BamE [Gallionella sp.]
MRTKLILLSVLLASCSDFSMPSGTLLAPYKMDIRQGNYITPEMREKLKLGMPRSQVHYVLGTPMISDAFHGNRWDYVYSLEHHGEIVEKQHLTLYFDGDNLVKIDDGKTVETAPVVAPPTIVPPVVAKQAVEPEAPKPPEHKPVAKADPEADVLKSVQGWAAAWSAKNARGYLAAYAAEFKPDGMSRAAWEKQRLDRIGKPKVIEVALSDINVSMEDDDHATVSFTQGYRSDNYRDRVEKTLQLVNQSGRWLIAGEHVGKAVKAKAKAQANEPAGASAQPLNASQQAVQDAVKRWADAWSARDTDKYLASYGAAFKPKEMSKAAWEAQRKERIGKAHSIAVKVSELQIKLHDGSHASATFMQDYRSDSYKDSARKTLLLEKTGDVWFIVAEQAAK